MPITSRTPDWCTAYATTRALETTRPVVADLDVLGVQQQIQIGALQRAVAERVDLLIQPLADRGDAVLGHPLDPNCSTSRSTFRVLTPLTCASITTAVIACSDRLLGSRNDGK